MAKWYNDRTMYEFAIYSLAVNNAALQYTINHGKLKHLNKVINLIGIGKYMNEVTCIEDKESHLEEKETTNMGHSFI